MSIKNNCINFKNCYIKINWSQSVKETPKLYDCSFDDMHYGFDLIALALKNDIMINDSDLLFYNSNYRNNNSDISNASENIICLQGISLSEGLDGKEIYDPNYDGIFYIDFEKIGTNIDTILFFIGRPMTDTENIETWIDAKKVASVLNEKIYADIYVNDTLVKMSSVFPYNLNGAMLIFKLIREPNSWRYSISTKDYKNGLTEIIKKYKRPL